MSNTNTDNSHIYFERPSEAVVYQHLQELCGGPGGRYMMSLTQLSKRCNLAMSTTNRAVLGLTQRGLLLYHPGSNQAHQTTFEIPEKTGENMPEETTSQPKISIPSANDIISDPRFPDFFNCDNNDMQVFHNQNRQDVPGDYSGKFAYYLAEGLDDLGNLALYKSYCQKYPVGIVLDAYQRAKETPQEKIKTSRGALFNYLTKIYAQKTNTKDFGHSPRSQGNGRISF